nr:MAG TPA: tail assembly chaperone protein [Caudoviricetes sp.]
MTTLVINGNEYNIKYGYEAVLQGNILEGIVDIEKLMEKDDTSLIDVKQIMEIVPDFLLAGMQKFHDDVFGYDLETGEGKAESLHKVYNLLDDYFDEEGSSFIDLFTQLLNELQSNGFLAKMLRDMMKEAKAEQKPKAPAKKTTRTTKKATA